MNKSNEDNAVVKRLAAGGDLTKFSRDELEDGLDAIAKMRRRDGESVEGSLVRLIRERDADLMKVAAALDAATTAAQQRPSSKQRQVTKARLHRNATDLLDQHVESHMRDGEDLPQAYARLASKPDHRFTALYEHLAEIQRDL